MKKIYRLFIIMMLSLMAGTSKAQNDGISLTLLPHFSYNNFYNPAMPVESNFVVGVGVSNIGLSVFNSSIRYDNLYSVVDGVSYFDANKFINSLEEHDNFINSNFSLDLFRLGGRIGKLFIDFDWRMKYNGEFHYSRDFLGFFINGNGNYLGDDNPADFSIGADVNFYSEMALGLQYKINDKLSVGIRPKLLLGVANLSINDDGTKIYTDENTYEMTADVNLNIEASTMLSMNDLLRLSEFATYFDSNAPLVMNEVVNFKENIGFGIDFGASYTFNEHFGVAAGVYDLGYIKWKDAKVKHNHIDNVVVNDALIDDFNNLLNMNLEFTDLYENLIKDVWGNDSIYSGDVYKTSLKTRVMLQGYYELCPLARFTAIGQMYYIKKQFRPALTLAYSGSFWRFLNFTASYTMSKYSGNSIGAGIGFNIGPLNIYAVTDNIMIVSKLNASKMEMFTSYEATNIRMGLVLTFGNKRK